jgi:hypothetical protein
MDSRRVIEKDMLMIPRPKMQYTPTRTAPFSLRICKKVNGRRNTGQYMLGNTAFDFKEVR